MRWRKGITTWAAAILAVAAVAPVAQAGEYTVHACDTPAGFTLNRAWSAVPAGGIGVSAYCGRPGAAIGLWVTADDHQVPGGAESRLVFTAPPGATIADFEFDGRTEYVNPAPASTHQFYILYRLGPTAFAGAGDYDDATRNRLNALGSWYGYPQGSADRHHRDVSKSSFPALSGYRGDATTLSVAVGCFARGTPCALAPGGEVHPTLTGAEVTVRDDSRPSVSAEAVGLLGGGSVSGREAVRFRAADNSGIRRVQLLDVTNPASAQVVGEEDYLAVSTEQGARCSLTLPRPCPDVAAETITAPSGLTGGSRRLELRVFDTAGNVAEAGPFSVDVVPPQDRGRLNGNGATERGSVSVRFARGKRRTRTVRYRSRTRVLGRVRNEAGRGVGDAIVRVWRRDERTGARWRQATTLRTRADGRFSWRARATASRNLRFDWPSHVNDPQAAASARLRLRARASARLALTPRRHIRRGDVLRFSGRVRGYGIPSDGVAVEILASGGGTFSVKTLRTDRQGRFRYRRCCWGGEARGRVTFYARVLGDSSFPYAGGRSNAVRRAVN